MSKSFPESSSDPIPTPRSLSRRQFMAGAAATGAVAAASTGSLTLIVPQAKANTPLRILTWPGYDEASVIQEFEEEQGIRVEFRTYIGGEQMLQFFNQTPRGTFDGIITDAEYIRKLTAIKAVEAINPADYPELENYHPFYREFPLFYQDDGNILALPTRFSFYGVSYNTKYFDKEEVKTWNVLFREELVGKVGIFDWYLPNMGNASLAISPNQSDPYDIDDEKVEQIRDWLIRLKPQTSLITPQNQDLVNAMINENIWAAPVGDLDLSLITEGFDNFSSTVPDEGSIRWNEGAALCADSRNKDLAQEWIRYMSRPDVQARLAYTRAFKARSPNLNVVNYWDEEQRELLGYVPDPDAPGRLKVEALIERSVPRNLPVQQDELVWQSAYNEFKTS
jgi:spermidine/putrescine transport system substrate-binding protein